MRLELKERLVKVMSLILIGCGSKFEDIYERVWLDVDAFEFATVGFEQK